MAVARTQTSRRNGNVAFRDATYSPASGKSIWEDCPLLAYMQDPSVGHLYYNDFHDYTAGDWTITTTEAGGGDATEVITDEAGGVLLITNDSNDDDSDELQKVGEAYKLVPGKPFWLEGKWKVSEAVQSDFIFGVMVTTATPIASGVVDGVYFLSDDGDADIDFHCEKNSTDTSSDTGANLADATFVRLGIKFDGAGNVTYHVDGDTVATSTTNIPDDEEMRLTFGLQNGDGNARTMSCDFIKCFQIS